MASNELIIDDDYLEEMGRYFVKQGEQIDRLIVKYISILQEVKNKAIISGEVSDVLSTYIMYVERINMKIGQISTICKTKIESFLTAVDSEDKYLF